MGQRIGSSIVSETVRSNKPSQFWRYVAQRRLAEKLFCSFSVVEYLLKNLANYIFLKSSTYVRNRYSLDRILVSGDVVRCNKDEYA